VALIHGAAHLGMEAEPLFVDTALLRGLRIKAGGSVKRGTASTSKTEGEAARPSPFKVVTRCYDRELSLSRM
jgi:hypothetical protein